MSTSQPNEKDVLGGQESMPTQVSDSTIVSSSAAPVIDFSEPISPPKALLAPSLPPFESLEEPNKQSTAVHYAPSAVASVRTTSTRFSNVGLRNVRGSRASLQSGQVDVMVKPITGALGTNAFRSDNSIISRDLLPRLDKEQDEQEVRFASLRNAFDWRFFIFVICNPVEYVWPLTFRRVAFWILYGGIAAGLYFLNKYFSWASGMAFAFRYQSIIAMSLIYGLEPLFMLLLYLIARLPPANKHTLPSMCERCLVDMEDGLDSPSNSETTALVIPCHKTDLVAFFNVLKGAFKHFAPNQIFIVENGNSPTPPDRELQDFCRRIDPRINYMWSPIASKNAAQYAGSLAAHSYDYIMTTDDDVVLPWNYRSPTEMITEEYKAVCFPIGARVARQQSWAGASSLVVSWQDIEFKASGLIKTAEHQLCGVLYPHGACSFWDRTTLLDALRMHSLVFYGEDTQLGLALQRMGKMIAIDASIILQTEVPASFLGPPLNYWQQRVRSWEMGRMSMLFKFISHLFRINGQRTITGFLAQKVLQFYALYSIACDIIRIPLFVIMYSRPGFWQKYALFSLAPILPPLLYKFVKARDRPDLEPALIPVLTFPLYKFIYQVVSCLGVLRCIFFYWPTYKHTKTIKEWEREDIFWLDDRFISNPGYLADTVVEGDDKLNESVEKLSEKEGVKSADLAAEQQSNEEHAELDLMPDLNYPGSFDARSHASRALTHRSRSRHTALNALLDADTVGTMSDKQKRMEQQLLRLEGALGRMENMLVDVSKRI